MALANKERASPTRNMPNQDVSYSPRLPLSFQKSYDRLSRIKAHDLCVNEYFDHDSPTYGSFTMMALGYDYMQSGVTSENLYMGDYSAVAAVNGWIHSDGHYVSMMKDSYHFVGGGVCFTPSAT